MSQNGGDGECEAESAYVSKKSTSGRCEKPCATKRALYLSIVPSAMHLIRRGPFALNQVSVIWAWNEGPGPIKIVGLQCLFDCLLAKVRIDGVHLFLIVLRITEDTTRSNGHQYTCRGSHSPCSQSVALMPRSVSSSQDPRGVGGIRFYQILRPFRRHVDVGRESPPPCPRWEDRITHSLAEVSTDDSSKMTSRERIT